MLPYPKCKNQMTSNHSGLIWKGILFFPAERSCSVFAAHIRIEKRSSRSRGGKGKVISLSIRTELSVEAISRSLKRRLQARFGVTYKNLDIRQESLEDSLKYGKRKSNQIKYKINFVFNDPYEGMKSLDKYIQFGKIKYKFRIALLYVVYIQCNTINHC